MSIEDSIKLMALKDYYHELLWQDEIRTVRGGSKHSAETHVRAALAEFPASLAVMREFIEWVEECNLEGAAHE